MKYDLMFTVIIPKYSNAGERISTEQLSKYVKEMAREFGGATVHPSVLGCWFDKEDDKLICEENMVVVSALDASELPEDEIERKRRFVKELAKKIGRDLGQYEVMAFEDVIDRLSFIEGKYRPHLPDSFKEHDYFKKLLD